MKGEHPHSPGDAWLALFVRYQIAPPPVAALDLTRRFTREAVREVARRTREAEAAATRKRDEPDEEARKREAEDWTQRARWSLRSKAYPDAIAKIVRDPRRYAAWKPSPDDAWRLATALAIAHGEPGFGFGWPEPDHDEEGEFLRSGLMSYFIEGELRLSAAKAAKATEEHISILLQMGQTDVTFAAGPSMAVDYSRAKTARAKLEVAAGRESAIVRSRAYQRGLRAQVKLAADQAERLPAMIAGVVAAIEEIEEGDPELEFLRERLARLRSSLIAVRADHRDLVYRSLGLPTCRAKPSKHKSAYVPEPPPPSLRGVLDFRCHFDALFQAALSLDRSSIPFQVNVPESYWPAAFKAGRPDDR